MPPDLLAYLLSAAVSLSGYPPVPLEELPPVTQVSHAQLIGEVCPEAPETCSGLAAVFDTEGYRILVSDRLDLEQASDNSFLVHELVHVLQHRAAGDAIYADCEATLRTETEAYRAQNAYLKREGQFLRYGEAMAFMRCAGQPDTVFTERALGGIKRLGGK